MLSVGTELVDRVRVWGGICQRVAGRCPDGAVVHCSPDEVVVRITQKRFV